MKRASMSVRRAMMDVTLRGVSVTRRRRTVVVEIDVTDNGGWTFMIR